MDEDYLEVYFSEYCHKCAAFEVDEDEEPCNSCLEECSNLNSHKPINYKEKEK